MTDFKDKRFKALILGASLAANLVPAYGYVLTPDPAVVVPPPPVAVASSALADELATARAMYDAANYRGVIDELTALRTRLQSPLPADATREFIFLLGASYFHTADPAALSLLTDYIADWPAGPKAPEARLLRADFFFYAHDWSEALQQYNAIPLSSLDAASRDLYTYRKALCQIRCGFFTEARAEVKKLSGVAAYALRSKYYLAYLDYVDGKDEAALRGFSAVDSALKSGVREAGSDGLVPEYYLAQLYFRRSDWTQAAALASSLLKGDEGARGRRLSPRASAASDPFSELRLPTERILGMSLYESGRQSQALPVLSRYAEAAGEHAAPDALYALGVCLYDENELTRAEECFSRVADERDAVGQGASLYLGQIAAKREDVSLAAMNFERAYTLNYDSRVAETALYNYVAARARGGNIPFDSNVAMLEEFIRNYPNSEYAPVIERHLATLYYNDGKYADALRVARRIARPSKADTLLLQSILYSGGTSALSAGKTDQAVDYLKECVALSGGDADVKAQASIWLGDALYDLADYRGAEKAYQDALKSGRAASNKVHLLYNLGYSQLRQNKFDASAKTFAEMLSSSVDIPDDMKRDARLRVADSKYYAGRYAEAKSEFAPLRDGGYGSDYAIYRYAQILGIEGHLGEKISELKRLESDYPASKWMPNALNELADTYVANGQNSEAAATYKRMLGRFPADASAARARLGMASALMDAGDAEEAVAAYKEILTLQPSTEEARLADKALREYYADRQELQEYARFLRGVPGFSIDAVEMERLAYEAAERRYLNDDDIAPLRKYLADYPGGRNNAEAWLLLAHHYQDAGDKANALAAYRELERVGGADYATEAYTGIMRMADNSGVRAEYARKLRMSGGASADALEEADFYLNEARLLNGSAAERAAAEKTMRALASNPFSEYGARSAVAVGEYLVEKGRPQEALDLMQEFTSSGSERQYWVARGFIVMADAYSALGDSYTAEEYLRSLQRNYPGDEEDIRRAVTQRLNK